MKIEAAGKRMTYDGDAAGYSIKAASEATGLPVETLRAWERRYRAIQPKRDLSGRRVYTPCDVSRLRRLREITALGHPIGKIAELSNERLRSLLEDRDANDGTAAALTARILAAVERYDPDACDQAVSMAFALLPLAEAVHGVLSAALREVGERWHRGEFTIAQERIASWAARRQLTALLTTFNGIAQGPGVVFATLSGERHEIGILMHAALSASRRRRTHYLGSDLPGEEIGRYARHVNASAVALGFVMPGSLEQSLGELQTLRRNLPERAEIWIGGSAAGGIDPKRFPAGSVLMTESSEFELKLALPPLV